MKNLLSIHAGAPAAAMLAILIAGCGHDDVKVYKVDANDTVVAPPPAAPAATAMPSSMPAGLPAPDNSGLPKLKYALPDGWKEKPLTQLRVASFEVSENGMAADVSVIPLGGSAGGDTANVNRWRGQVGQAPLDENTLGKSAETVQIAGQAGALYDLAGTTPGSGDPERILGATLHSDDTVWYFQNDGRLRLGGKTEAELHRVLEIGAIRQAGCTVHDGCQPVTRRPSSHFATGGGERCNPAADKPTWTVPAGWQPGELAQFLAARFVIAGDGDASAAVNVSQLSGDGGGLAANVNRWRKQLGQSLLADATSPVCRQLMRPASKRSSPISLARMHVPANRRDSSAWCCRSTARPGFTN
jgi:hypothetical protein